MIIFLFYGKSNPVTKIIVFQKLELFFVILFSFFTANSFSQSLTAEEIYEKVTGAVVVIHAYNSMDELAKQGSGVVINDKGYVVTNYHVLEGCERLEVLHNKEVVPYVDIIGIDVEKDILILKIEENKFPAIKIGNAQKINIGQRVYAIGSPLGFENSISEGIISGLRGYEKSGRNFIQITASISSGSSGGAVVNDKGELIGISTLTASEGQNLNFAIPIDDALAVKIGSYSKNESYKDFELFSKGYDAAEKGNYQEAINYYTGFLRKYLSDEIAYFNRGVAKFNLTDYRGAIQDYTKAIEINPDYADAYLNRGIAMMNLKDCQGAIQDFNKAIEINQNFASAYFCRGVAKDDLEDYGGAIADYTKAIELEPNDAGAYINRGILKGKLGVSAGEIQDYTKAIEINPNDASAYFNRGNAKARSNDNRGAIQDFNQAIELNPIHAGAYNGRGFVKNQLSDYRGAIQDFNKAIQINPNAAQAYMNRGMTKIMMGDKDGGCLDFSKAGELGHQKAYDAIKEFCK